MTGSKRSALVLGGQDRLRTLEPKKIFLDVDGSFRSR